MKNMAQLGEIETQNIKSQSNIEKQEFNALMILPIEYIGYKKWSDFSQ